VNSTSKQLPLTSSNLKAQQKVTLREKSVPGSESRHLDWFTVHDLTDLVRISPLWLLERMYPWLFLGIVIATVVAVRVWLYGNAEKTPISLTYEVAFTRIYWLGMLLRVFILDWWRKTLSVKIDGFMLRTEEGVIWRTRTSFAFTGFMTIMLRQSAFQVLFRKYTVSIFTVNLPSEGLSSFPCMTKKNAYRLKAYLTAQLNRTANLSSEAIAMETERKRKADTLLEVAKNASASKSSQSASNTVRVRPSSSTSSTSPSSSKKRAPTRMTSLTKPIKKMVVNNKLAGAHSLKIIQDAPVEQNHLSEEDQQKAKTQINSDKIPKTAQES
jgi:hypothetical protein